MNKPEPILGLTNADLQSRFEEWKESSYRAKQVSHWLFRQGVESFDDMTNLSAALRGRLKENFSITNPLVEEFLSSDGTKKFRFQLEDDKQVEAVWIPDERRKTLCVSSQVGCALGCKFCVTGAVGFTRNLRVDEIVAQVRHVKIIEKLPVTNIVFMGMGEPLLNPKKVLQAIRVITCDNSLGIGRRKITVSTVGIIPEIANFLREADVPLAVSLTGSSEKERNHWMPINRKYSLKKLMDTLRIFPWRRGKKVTFEVVLLAGRTDSEEQAEELARAIHGVPCMVNLIPYNENPFFPELRSPSREMVLRYQNLLIQRGIRAMIRKSRGMDIMAACGQLAGETNQDVNKENK